MERYKFKVFGDREARVLEKMLIELDKNGSRPCICRCGSCPFDSENNIEGEFCGSNAMIKFAQGADEVRERITEILSAYKDFWEVTISAEI